MLCRTMPSCPVYVVPYGLVTAAACGHAIQVSKPQSRTLLSQNIELRLTNLTPEQQGPRAAQKR